MDEQGGPAGQFCNHHVLIWRMRSVAHRSQSIERRHAECGSEVTVRAATRIGLLQSYAEGLGQIARQREKLCARRSALKWWPIDSPGDEQMRAPVPGPEGTQPPIDSDCIRHLTNAHVDDRLGLCRNNVASTASTDDAGV